MSTHKHFDKICYVVLALTLLLTVLFLNAERFGVEKASTVMGYEDKLFSTSTVHTIDIRMEDWDEFIEGCESEEYSPCTVVIDDETYQNVAIRAKGNTSLTQVKAYGNDRYSFKIEFDHYDSSKTYYGLDKLCLNNVIQDNTYMKEYFSYRMMSEAGAAAPLCSYVNISVNGEPWGLYLAVEGVEEAFLKRNYGSDYGELYKPDSMDMGGRNFEETGEPGKFPDHGSVMGNSDVLLQYTDDDPDSYSNIFDNAKTEVSAGDKTRLIEALKCLNEREDLENTVDTDSVIRYFVAHNFVLNFDSYTGSMIHNYYLYEKDGQLSMLPWDYNLAFGGFESAGGADSLINHPIDTPVSGGSVNDRPMLSWIFSDEAYTELYHQYFSLFISEYLESDRFAEEIDSVTDLIAPYVEEDPTKFCTYEEFTKGANTLKEFCLLRAKSVRGQLEGTIGSTTDTQEQDTLVTGNGLSIADMGSMNNSGQGPENRDTAGNNTPPGLPDSQNSDNRAEAPAPDGGPFAPNDSRSDMQVQGMPQMPGKNNGEAPAFSDTSSPPGNGTSSPLVLTGISVLVLLCGLLFARLFKTRV